MIAVYGENYINDYRRSKIERTFKDLDEMFDFLSDHVDGRYVRQISIYTPDSAIRLGTCTIFFKKDESVDEICEHEPGRITSGCQLHNGSTLYIYKIVSDRGIEYSSGDLTAGKKHASQLHREWTLNKTKNVLCKNKDDYAFVA